MKCTARLGYAGVVYLVGERGMSAFFVPRRKTLTGATLRNGEKRCLTASTVKRYLNITQDLKRVKDKIDLDDDKGIFNEINAVDIYQNATRCYSVITVPVTVLRGAAKLLEGRKQ